MIHSYDTTVARAAQRRSQLEAEAARRRLVQEARQARGPGARPIPHHRRARALSVLTRVVGLSAMRRRTVTSAEASLQARPVADVVDLTAMPTAHPTELVDARSDGDSRAARCG